VPLIFPLSGLPFPPSLPPSSLHCGSLWGRRFGFYVLCVVFMSCPAPHTFWLLFNLRALFCGCWGVLS
jgi:hypothetical protein